MQILFKQLRLWMVVLFCCAAVHADPLKIVSLNLEWFPGHQPQPTIDEVIKHIADTRNALAELSPDILISTEICSAEAFRDVLHAVPGMELRVISNFTDAESKNSTRNQQIAIASRLPAYAGWAEHWEASMEGMRRGFSFAALENTNTGHLILVYGLHLKSNRNGNPEEEKKNYDLRDASIDQLLVHMKKMEEKFAEHGIDGWIVAGDFNTNHDGKFGDKVIAKMEEAGFWNSWRNTAPENRYTWKAGHETTFQPTTFDYIMLKGFNTNPDATLQVMPFEVSDHNAVVVKLDLTAPSDKAQPAETGSQEQANP